MFRLNRMKTFFILILFLGVASFSQDKQTNAERDKELREEILAVYKSKGEQGLRNFFKNNQVKITNKFIVDFANAGINEQKDEWIKMCEILAKEQKDKKIMAEIYYIIGKYYRINSDYKNAIDFFEKAFPIYKKLNDFLGQGKAYLGKVDVYMETADYMRAEKLVDQTLYFFEKAGSQIGQGHVYFRKGDIYYFTADSEKALEMYDKALSFFDKKEYLWGQGNVHMKKGDIYFYAGKNSYALDMYNKALFFFEKDKNVWGQGLIHMRMGRIYFGDGDYSKSIAIYDKGMRLFESIGALDGIGDVYYRKAEIYKRLCEYSTALELFEKAQSCFEKTSNPIGLGNVYLEKGEVYLLTGDISKAKEMYDKSLVIFRKTGNIFGKANVYEQKADIHYYSGNIIKSLYMLEEALYFYKKTGNISGQGYVYLKKGKIYARVRNYQKALELIDKAKLCFKNAEYPFALGEAYFDKGGVYFYLGNYIDADKMYEKALYFYKKAGTIQEQCNVYLKKGDIYLKKGKKSKALKMYETAFHFYKKVDDPFGQGNVYRTKGYIYSKTSDILKALDMYEKAFYQYSRVEDIESMSNALQGKAWILAKQFKKYEALILFEKAISNLEEVRCHTAISEMKKSFFERVYEQYQETVLFMLENGYYKKGFKYAEAMRSRVFLDKMAEELVRLEKGLKPELKEQRDNMVGKLSTISKQMQKTVAKDEKKMLELKEKYQKAQSEFEELLIKIRLENPLYAQVRYPQPITVEELQKDVLKEGESLVRYFISPETLYVFLVSKESFKVVPIKIKEKDIKNIVERYLLAIKENNSGGMRRYGAKLYRELFQPLEKDIPLLTKINKSASGGKGALFKKTAPLIPAKTFVNLKKQQDIIITPDGNLAKIPFESFIVDKNKRGNPVFLIEKYRLKYIQSASVLSVLRKHYLRDNKTKSFVGFGDPVYDYENFKKGLPEKGSDIRSTKRGDEIWEIHHSRYARDGGVLNRLRSSGEAVNTISSLFKKYNQKSVLHIRDQATEENAKAGNMKDFDFIHFACHGLLNEDFQSLVLSQLPPEKSKEDGYFTLNEIMNCDYNAKLVVLSACQTGSGKMERGEGVTGPTRAVMYAGTLAVVASLWDVDDRATKELMVNFYQNMLGKNMDKVEALRQVKLELIKNKKYSSPIFWSAFVMYGE